MTETKHTIIYTQTDEAPALATASLLPVIATFTAAAGVEVELRDISLAARVLAAVPRGPHRRTSGSSDDLAELGALVERPEANVIKLPNVSASIPQLKATIEELQAKGYTVPDYPDEPPDRRRAATPRPATTRSRARAVNPVLREGNSDRRAPGVGQEVRPQPPALDGCLVARLQDPRRPHGRRRLLRATSSPSPSPRPARCRSSWSAPTAPPPCSRSRSRSSRARSSTPPFMSAKALDDFLAAQLADAKAEGVLFSIHLKATMMKVSDPIIFGHAVKAYFADVFAKHADDARPPSAPTPTTASATCSPGSPTLSDTEQTAIEADIAAAIAAGPPLAMVDSDQGITNLHVPSDVIVDASMPADDPRLRARCGTPAGEQQDTKAVIPDSSYAGVYEVVIEDCKANGAFDPATMGSVPNVGLMAQKAEEYGSHDKTFEIPADGTVRVVDQAGTVLMEHTVEAGDIWRACQAKDAPIRDWVKLAVTRARATGAPAVFWLDAQPGPRRPAHREGERLPRRPRHRRA